MEVITAVLPHEQIGMVVIGTSTARPRLPDLSKLRVMLSAARQQSTQYAHKNPTPSENRRDEMKILSLLTVPLSGVFPGCRICVSECALSSSRDSLSQRDKIFKLKVRTIGVNLCFLSYLCCAE